MNIFASIIGYYIFLPPAKEVWGKVMQVGHILAKMKFPVFCLSFPCVTEIFPVLFLCKN